MNIFKANKTSLEAELNVPLANLDLEEWFDSILSSDNSEDDNGSKINKTATSFTNNNNNNNNNKTNLTDSISICSSLEDLVKSFDKNVKECLVNYKDIDIGQLAPVQVRSQEDIMKDSQIWYTLTGNFGNLWPIDYDYWSSSRSLVRKYHDDSLNIRKPRKKLKKLKHNERINRFDFEDDDDDYNNTNSDNDEQDMSEYSFKSNSDEWLFEKSNKKNHPQEMSSSSHEDYEEYEDQDNNNDDEELRDQLDMHSMILVKSIYNDDDENEESLITAEQVLSEIETFMQDEDYEAAYNEMTPDSGCYSITSESGLMHSNTSHSFNSILNSPPTPSNTKDESVVDNATTSDIFATETLPIDLDGSYLKYISTFALAKDDNNNNNFEAVNCDINSKSLMVPVKKSLQNLNIYELNDLIEQIEMNTKELSDILVNELNTKDELEFEKETKNTFISLLMSIQEKRRLLLSNENINLIGNGLSYSFHSHTNRHHLSNLSISLSQNQNIISNKKRNRRSLASLDMLNNSTHLTTVIPYNSEIKYTVQDLQILNKLLKAINEQSQQVPELLTNYILKVVCPT